MRTPPAALPRQCQGRAGGAWRYTQGGCPGALRLLCESGDLVRDQGRPVLPRPGLTDILDRVRGWFATHDNLDVGGLKELLGLSRKYLIALLEYMDNEHITRVGDQRRFRGR